MKTREEKPVRAAILAAAALALVLLCGLFLARPAEAAFPTDNGRIAFSRDRDGNVEDNGEIYVIDPDGSGQTRLTNNPASEEGFPTVRNTR